MSTNAARLLIYNAQIYGLSDIWEQGWLLTNGKAIEWVGPGSPPDFGPASIQSIDASGNILLPGFIDLHVHGAVGHEVMDADPQGLREMARFYARHGVTSFLATTWTAAHEAILAALEAVGQVMETGSDGATILGLHLEGPYLNAEKCGAQDARLIRRARREETIQYLDSGLVRLLALAPEFAENQWLIEECVRRGITVSAGHTTAGYEVLKAAADRGVRQVTHCFNAMTPLGHRELGTVGAAMALPAIKCELIADNIHVHPAAQRILVDVKGPSGVILITDAIRGAGLPGGSFRIDERTVTVVDGAARLPDGTLAGSVLTLDRGLKNILKSTGRSLKEAWPMTSLNAAEAIGLSASKGSIERGKDADLVMLDKELNVQLTVVEGRMVYQAA